MSAETVATATTGHPEHADHGGEVHESHDRMYVKIACILAVLTFLEMLTYFESIWPDGVERYFAAVLLVLMGIKFYLISAYFMHLRWDKPVLKRVFITGIVIAVVVYLIMLTAFNFWSGPGVMPH